MKYINKTLVALGVLTALVGCSPEEQDVPNESQSSVVAKGAVIDPFITSAIVFADYDEDGVLDVFEPWAFTDENGYYSVGLNGEEYCSTTPKYCLELPNSDAVKLVAVGGYDLTTLKKITSRLSRIFTGSGDQFITPLTSVGNMSLDELGEIDKDVNIMIDAFASTDSAFSLGYKVHKVVELISELVTQEYPAIGDDEEFPTDISSYVYDAINKLGTNESLSLTTLLDELTDDQIDTILDDVRAELDTFTVSQNSAVASKELSSSFAAVPAQLSSNELAAALRNFVTQYDVAIASAIDAGITIDGETSSAAIRLIEGIKGVFNDAVANDTTVSAAELTSVIENTFASNAILVSLADVSFDLSLLSLDSLVDLESSLTTMSERPQLPNNLSGMEFVLSDDTSSRESTVALFFTNSNQLSACVKYQNLEDINDSQNTNGVLLTGSWEQTEYSIDLSLTLAGTEEALRIKTNTTDSYIFDYDNDETVWDTTADFVETVGDAPTTDEACQDWIAELSNTSDS